MIISSDMFHDYSVAMVSLIIDVAGEINGRIARVDYRLLRARRAASARRSARSRARRLVSLGFS